MYPGGTWMGGIDPFGDIMGTSAGPAGEEKKYLFRVNSHLHLSIGTSHTQWGGTNTATHTLRGRPLGVELLSCATSHFCRSTCVLGYRCWSPGACWPLTPDKIIYKQCAAPHNFLFMFMRFMMRPLHFYLKVHQFDAFNVKKFETFLQSLYVCNKCAMYVVSSVCM